MCYGGPRSRSNEVLMGNQEGHNAPRDHYIHLKVQGIL